jgi:putative ABC transport system permease protein
MYFLTIAAKNLARRPARTLLTLFGVALGVAAVVSLWGAVESIESSYLAVYTGREVDLVVQRRGGMVQLSKGIAQSFGDRIRALPQARLVMGGLLDMVSFEDRGLYMVLVEGIEPTSIALDRVKVTDGRRLRAGDEKCVMLGRGLAANLGKRPGEIVEIYSHPFKVVGVFDSLSRYENGSVFMLLDELQRQMDRTGQVTGFLVQAEPPGDPAAVASLRQRIEAIDPTVAAIQCEEFVGSLSQMRVLRTASWVIATIAGAIGSLGILNTMAMSIFERRAEIGALRAVGWRKSRVVRLILDESLMLAVAGAALGIPIGAAALAFLGRWRVTSTFVQGNLSPRVVGVAILVASVMAMVGALYPALRIARVPPDEALRAG